MVIDFLKCYEVNNCGREEHCIGAMYDDKCWTRAGTYANPPEMICMLLEKKWVASCDACSYFKIMKKLLEVTELVTTIKKEVAKNNGT
jgi:hypothetical protein